MKSFGETLTSSKSKKLKGRKPSKIMENTQVDVKSDEKSKSRESLARLSEKSDDLEVSPEKVEKKTKNSDYSFMDCNAVVKPFTASAKARSSKRRAEKKLDV